MIFKKRFRSKRLPRINAALEMRRNQSFVQGTAPDRSDIFFSYLEESIISRETFFFACGSSNFKQERSYIKATHKKCSDCLNYTTAS